MGVLLGWWVRQIREEYRREAAKQIRWREKEKKQESRKNKGKKERYYGYFILFTYYKKLFYYKIVS